MTVIVDRTEDVRSSRLNRVRRATTLALTVCGAVVLGNGAAAAAVLDNIPSVKVSYDDLDLARPKGVAVLYGRLQFAARRVCRPFESPDLGRQTLWRQCLSRALSDAVAKVDQPTLTTYYRAKTEPRSTAPAITTAKN